VDEGKYLFVDGPWHGRIDGAYHDTWVVTDGSGRRVIYSRQRWSGAVDGRLVGVELMTVLPNPGPQLVAGAMALAWMREHGRVVD